jgi:hypothetical protein
MILINGFTGEIKPGRYCRIILGPSRFIKKQ